MTQHWHLPWPKLAYHSAHPFESLSHPDLLITWNDIYAFPSRWMLASRIFTAWYASCNCISIASRWQFHGMFLLTALHMIVCHDSLFLALKMCFRYLGENNLTEILPDTFEGLRSVLWLWVRFTHYLADFQNQEMMKIHYFQQSAWAESDTDHTPWCLQWTGEFVHAEGKQITWHTLEQTDAKSLRSLSEWFFHQSASDETVSRRCY